MAVLITKTGEDEVNGIGLFEAVDLDTNEPVTCKNWFEKSKDKWHIVLGPNSANRKYIAHNEFNANNKDGEYEVEDKTTGPRVLGTAQPDRKLVPFMSIEDKAEYDRIIAAAIANREAQSNIELSEEEKLEAQIAKLTAKLEAKKAATPAVESFDDEEPAPTPKKAKSKKS